MAYSIDYKKRALAYKDEGHTFKELFEAFKISSATYYDWKNKHERGVLDVKIKRTRNRKVDPEKLKKVVEEQPDLYLRELAAIFDVSETAIHKRLENLNITVKKRLLPTPKNPSRTGLNLSKK
ncbi:MAG: transposase [Oscillospiraceae bacterium]|jgi:putative transposase|nr:transposase [Oscillospiraceae bacterium]